MEVPITLAGNGSGNTRTFDVVYAVGGNMRITVGFVMDLIFDRIFFP